MNRLKDSGESKKPMYRYMHYMYRYMEEQIDCIDTLKNMYRLKLKYTDHNDILLLMYRYISCMYRYIGQISGKFQETDHGFDARVKTNT